MRETRAMYMHTIDGRPASWGERERELYFAGGRTSATLHPSLTEIRRQQRQSTRTRVALGFNAPTYGYVRVEVPRG